MFGLGKKKDSANSAEQLASPPTPSTGDYLVQYDRRGCIGAAVCEAFSPHFVVHEDKKAELTGAVFNPRTAFFEKVITAADMEQAKQAADGCPTNVIHIINLKTGEKII